MFLNKNFKKIISGTLIAVTFFGISSTAKSLTTADVELLISLGIIPAQNAQNARDYLNLQNNISSNTGNIIKTDPLSNKECLILNQNLVKGKSGTAVSALQKFLKSEGHFPLNEPVTGVFGDITLRAVADFQVATGLIKTSKQIGAGTVGPVTRSKIQEVSCKKLIEEPAPVVTATTTTATATTTVATTTKSRPNIKTAKIVKDPIVTLGGYERYVNTETGDATIKYEVNIKSATDAAYLESIVVCDPSAITFNSPIFKECGEMYVIKPIVKGRKTINIGYKNKTRVMQPVVFAIEAFDENDKSLGFAEVRNEVPNSKPVIKLQVNNTTINKVGVDPIRNNFCSRDQQLEFIRYTLSPYDPLNPVSLPICWPGELLCNRSYPPSYCKITAGPSSDDLCIKSQKFVNGKCVPRE